MLQSNNKHSDALTNLGCLYVEGLGVEQDPDRATELFDDAIALNNSRAMGFKAMLIEQEGGDSYDVYKLYERAAALGDIEGLNQQAYMLHMGQGVPKNFVRALKCYTEAAERGSADAQYNLGALHQQGEPADPEDESGGFLAKDDSKAFKWYEMAAEQGHAGSLFALGQMYKDGSVGVNQDYTQAMQCFQAAAEGGDLDGMTELGCMYKDGLGVEQDYHAAAEWLLQAADQVRVRILLSAHHPSAFLF